MDGQVVRKVATLDHDPPSSAPHPCLPSPHGPEQTHDLRTRGVSRCAPPSCPRHQAPPLSSPNLARTSWNRRPEHTLRPVGVLVLNAVPLDLHQNSTSGGLKQTNRRLFRTWDNRMPAATSAVFDHVCPAAFIYIHISHPFISQTGLFSW